MKLNRCNKSMSSGMKVQDVLNSSIQSLDTVQTFSELNELRDRVERVMDYTRKATDAHYKKNNKNYKTPENVKEIILHPDIQSLYDSFDKSFNLAKWKFEAEQILSPPLTVRIKSCISALLPSRRTILDYAVPSFFTAGSIIEDDPIIFGIYAVQQIVANLPSSTATPNQPV